MCFTHERIGCALCLHSLPAEVKLYSSFSQRLHERVRLSRELNKLIAMYSWLFMFSPDS